MPVFTISQICDIRIREFVVSQSHIRSHFFRFYHATRLGIAPDDIPSLVYAVINVAHDGHD